MENKDFQTTDLILASTLSSFSYPIKNLSGEGDRFTFYFAMDTSITDVVDQFNNDKICVEPKKYTFCYRTLKRRIFDRLRAQKGGLPNE